MQRLEADRLALQQQMNEVQALQAAMASAEADRAAAAAVTEVANG